MGNGISSQPAFRSLGAREGFVYTDNEKAQLFSKGIASIKALLENPHAASKPKSVAELVSAIFDPASSDPQIEAIREVLRPTYKSSSYTISATGTKLLACLAITENRDCFDQQGNLRVDYTKNLISQWFSNPNEVLLDESALNNIRLDSTDRDENGDPRIILGQNRLSSVDMHYAMAVSEKIELNRQAANLGRQVMKFDLSSRPVKTHSGSFNEAVVGDMNGNSLMFLHQLVQLGFAEIPPGKEQYWDQLVNKIKTDNLDDFRDLLPKALDLKQLDKKLILLGDLLSDRAFNDWFTLSIIDFLHEKNQKFDIIFSNHDAAFVEYYFININKDISDEYCANNIKIKESNNAPDPNEKSVKNEEFKHVVSPNDSLVKLNNKLNNQRSLRIQFLQMTSNYISHLKFMGCSEDQATLYSHGIINANMMNDMLKAAGKDTASLSSMGIQQKTDAINSHFKSKALVSLEEFQKFFYRPRLDQQSKDGSDSNPFFLALWNIGPFSDNDHIPKIPDHKYLNAEAPQGVSKVVHGHCIHMRKKFDDEQAILQNYMKLESLMTRPNPPSDLKDWIGKCIQLFIELEASFANPKDLGTMFTLFLAKARSLAHLADNTGLEICINRFFDYCFSFPKSEDIWFNNYSSNDPNDPVMQVKKGLKPQDPSKTQYIDLPEDQTIKDIITRRFRQIQDDYLALHRPSAQDLFNVLHEEGGISDAATILPDKALDSFVHTVATSASAALTMPAKKAANSPKGKAGLHAFLIGQLASEAIGNINNQPLYKTTLDAAHGMRNYASLEGTFGANETDTVGTRSIFLT